MTNITLKQLRYFEALARHRHFGRAAAACTISQPALSVQIREMEEELGAPLFERGARRARLTALGEDVAGRVRGILGAVEELDDIARAGGQGLAGRLRLGVIPTIGPYLLPRVIAALSQAHPGIDFHVRETLTERLIGEMLDGRLDTAIVALPVSERTLTEVPLFEERFVLVRPAGDAGKPVPDAEDLREMRLLLLEEGHCFREQALSFCNLRTAAPREALDASSLSTLVQMVGAGVGVTLIPEMAVPVETRSAEVSVARFRTPEPSRRVGMIWRRTSPLAAQLERLAEVVRKAALAEGGAGLEQRVQSQEPLRAPGLTRGLDSQATKAPARGAGRERV